MVAGHEGRTGRGGSIRQDAEIMAWLIAHARKLNSNNENWLGASGEAVIAIENT